MKNFKKLVICIVLTLTLLFTLTACADPPNLPTGDYSVVYENEIPKLQTNAEGEFNILQISDTHFISGETKKDKSTLSGINGLIADDRYDLVVMTGDMVEGHNKNHRYNKAKALDAIAQVFENNKQYWCFIAGNNDGEYCGSVEDIMLYLNKYEHAIILDTPNLEGTGNYHIPIYNGENEVHRLLFLDSHMRNPDNNYKIDAFGEKQVNWYRQMLADCSEKDIFASTFFHSPMLEMNQAFSQGEIVSNYNASFNATTDETANQPMLDVMIDSSRNGLMGTGHLHSNDYASYYRGMYWLNVRSGGKTVNLPKNLKHGGAAITIKTNSNIIKNMYSFQSVNYQ